MTTRGNKPVGAVTRIMMALSLVLIVIGIVVGLHAGDSRQAFPERGAAALPGQVADAGVVPAGQR